MSRLTNDLKHDSLPYAYKEMRNEGTEQEAIYTTDGTGSINVYDQITQYCFQPSHARVVEPMCEMKHLPWAKN